MNILAIDTSTESLSICLKTKIKLYSIIIKAGFKHSETLVPWIDRLCVESDISPEHFNLIIVGTGPGSFTGLRIGLATAKGLAAGAACPIIGVSSLDAAAWGLRYYDGIVAPVIDARKNQFYSALYINGKRTSDYFDITIDKFIEKLKGIIKPVLLTCPFASQLYNMLYNTMNDNKQKNQFFLDPNSSLINPNSLLDMGLIIFKKQGTKMRISILFILEKAMQNCI